MGLFECHCPLTNQCSINLGNAENQTRGRWMQSKNAIHCATTAALPIFELIYFRTNAPHSNFRRRGQLWFSHLRTKEAQKERKRFLFSGTTSRKESEAIKVITKKFLPPRSHPGPVQPSGLGTISHLSCFSRSQFEKHSTEVA